MFGKLMNRYYYGKSGKGDFTKEDLPKNRLELLGSTLRTRLSSLITLNLLYVVTLIPTLFVIGRTLIYLYQGLAVAEQYAAGELTEASVTYENYSQFAIAVLFQNMLFFIPAFLITGPFTCGVAYVCRNWARDEHAFVWIDFRDAVKANWKQGLLISLISSVMPIIVLYTSYFYGQMAQSNWLFMIPELIIFVLAFIWLLMTIYLYPLAVTYELSFKNLIRNGCLLAIGRLPQSLGLFLLSLFPTVLFWGIGYLVGQYYIYAILAWALYYVLIGFTLIRFVYASYANAVFDRYLNQKIPGAKVEQGLYHEEDE